MRTVSTPVDKTEGRTSLGTGLVEGLVKWYTIVAAGTTLRYNLVT